MTRPGRRLSHYELFEEIGRGGMGLVYRALDVKLKREAAIKILPPHLVADGDRKQRFIREAQAAAGLRHPGIAVIYEVDEDDGTTFIAMELIEGRTLSRVVADGALEETTIVDLGTQIAEALACAHDRGIIHRDLKPTNIMLADDGHVKIIDFGLAKFEAPGNEHLDPNQHETEPGIVMGTFAYMSPEQASGRAVDHRSDLWALGAVLYTMATGKPPLRADSPVAHVYTNPSEGPWSPSLSDLTPGTSERLQRIVHKALQIEPGARYQTAHELIEDLKALNAGTPFALEHPSDDERPGMVGRTRELDELLARLASAATGQGSLILIGGEPGVGKTRLAREVLSRAKTRGILPLIGHCEETEEGAPFLPFVECLEEAMRIAPRSALRRALGRTAPEIAQLVPQLGRAFDDIRAPIRLPPEQRRRYLFNSVLELMERASRSCPMVLVLDDLHWADESSLLLLEHIAPHVKSLAVLVLGTHRDVELEVGRPFDRTMSHLIRKRFARRIALKRLSQQHTRELLEASMIFVSSAGTVKARTTGCPLSYVRTRGPRRQRRRLEPSQLRVQRTGKGGMRDSRPMAAVS